MVADSGWSEAWLVVHAGSVKHACSGVVLRQAAAALQGGWFWSARPTSQQQCGAYQAQGIWASTYLQKE
jgi:hypothetical protein